MPLHARRGAAVALSAALTVAGIPTPARAEVTQADIDAAQARLIELSNQAGEADSALQETLYQLDQTRTDRDACAAQVEQHAKSLREKQAVLADYVSSDYKAGPTGLMELLLGAESIEDLAGRIRYAAATMRQHEEDIIEVRTLKDELEQERDELDELEASLVDLAGQQEEAAASLEASTAAQQSYLDGLSEEMRRQVEEAERARQEQERAQAEALAQAAQEKAEAEASRQDSQVADAPKDEGAEDPSDVDGASDAKDDDKEADKAPGGPAKDTPKDSASKAQGDPVNDTAQEPSTDDVANGEPEGADAQEEPATVPSAPVTSDLGQSLVAAAMSQIGVPYRSCHYGPKGDPFGRGEGFGCAMFVAYCYNHVLFNDHDGMDSSEYPVYSTGFVGWTQSFWSSVARQPYGGINPGFVEVSADEAQPGDVLCYVDGPDPYSSGNNCHHVSLYVGNGQQMSAGGGGPTGFNMHQGNLHYLHYVGA